jgi:hypothetical protein
MLRNFYDIIKSLVSNIEFLNNIVPNKIIEVAVETDGRALELVEFPLGTSIESKEIIKLADQKLELIPSYKIKDVIIRLIVQYDYHALKYVFKYKMSRAGDARLCGLDYSSSPAARMTDEIIKLAVEK